MRLATLALLASLAATGARTEAAPETKPPKLRIDDRELPREEHPKLSFKHVVEAVSPAVVNIYSTRTTNVNPMMQGMMNDPMLRRFFGVPPESEVPRERQERSLGSGVIVTTDGYIITNNHVVEGADSIRVALPGDQRELDAKLIGTDPPTDIAVLKVDDTGLTAATLGDSDQLAVGDVVLALGNPFNVGQTVTMGIAGAIQRGGFGIEAYEDFIQTDASINPGNSGGPLIDGLGRVVGINTAILSRSGGNQGVGFAVPINLARHVFEQLVQSGKVSRGFLGVIVQPVTSDLAQEFGLERNSGALVADVSDGGPADKAGVKSGDVITQFAGTDVRDSRHLQLLVAQQAPDSSVDLRVLRDGKPQTLTVTLATRTDDESMGNGSPGAAGNTALFSGMQFQDLDANLREQIGAPADINGAVITEVAPGSNAAEAGLRPGDVILEINRQPVQSTADIQSLANKAKNRALLRVWSRGGVAFVVLQGEPAENEQ